MINDFQQGRVVSIRGRDIHVFSCEKTIITYLKNSIKREKSDQKNLIAIGDTVLFNDKGQIESICQRKTILQRMDPLNPRKRHVLGANIDQVFITFAIQSPDIDIPMVDRYIIAAQKGGLFPIVIINKVDLIKDKSEIAPLIALYKLLEIPIIALSIKTKEGVDELIHLLEGKTSIFSGPSGAGKSSIINLITGGNLTTGEISEKIQKGKHTTTFSSLIPLKKDTYIIDSPGIASFSNFNVSKEEVLIYFSDLNKPLGDCKYKTCSHTHEPFRVCNRPFWEINWETRGF
jgi:ribosome biogenesis GTPase